MRVHGCNDNLNPKLKGYFFNPELHKINQDGLREKGNNYRYD